MKNIKVLLKKAIKKILLQNPNSLFTKQEETDLVHRMDSGDFNFSPEEEQKMIRQWHFCNSACPFPSRLKAIFEGNDAFLMNGIEAGELTFRLPYGAAYEEAQNEEYKRIVAFAQERIGSFDNQIVLDAGCGFGGLLSCIRESCPTAKCMGIEYAKSAIQTLSKKRPWIQAVVANIEDETTDFQKSFPGQANIIFCTEVLEHLARPKKAVKNLLSIKSKNDILICTVPNGRMDHASQHINFWSPESWKLWIEDAAPEHAIEFTQTSSQNAPIGYNLCAVIRDRQ
jgi:2-polyprenyl-3-methyl-5-hydroxy-6-metoxy-1,4-benzoquinol methylase